MEADRPFIVEMARFACVIEDRPLPEPGASEVVAMLPAADDHALIADDDSGSLGAAWWFFHQPPLLLDDSGAPLPEMIVALRPEARGRGVGRLLVEELVARAARDFETLSLNVHIRNPAARLYSRTGFTVAGKGRGPLGVAMVRPLRAPDEP